MVRTPFLDSVREPILTSINKVIHKKRWYSLFTKMMAQRRGWPLGD